MNQFKKSSVVMLSTNQKTNIFLNRVNNKLLYDKEKTIDKILPSSSYQHLYILSDEKIKKGDICFSVKYNEIVKHNYSSMDIQEWELYKVIASTDLSLNLPRPSNSFIRKYCQNNGIIKEVLVEYEEMYSDFGLKNFPIYNLKVSKDNSITIRPIKNSFTREEVISLCTTVYHETHFDNIPRLFSIEEWINKNI